MNEDSSERDMTGPDLPSLESRVEELERLADSLGDAPDEELIASLDRAVGLLAEINSGIESGLKRANEEARDLEGALGDVGFGPFDEALSELEKRERRADA